MTQDNTDAPQGMEKPAKAEFDPRINYEWQADEIFSLKGIELNILKRVLDAQCSTEAAQRIIGAYESLKIIDGILKKGVEDGKILPAKVQPEEIKTQ